MGKPRKDKPFVVVVDAYPTCTTELADVVLPAAMWSEKEGVFGMSERRYQLLPKIIEPFGEGRSDFDILLDLAARLEKAGVVPEGYISKKFTTPAEIWDEMRESSRGTPYDFTGITRERLKVERGLRWPCPTGALEPLVNRKAVRMGTAVVDTETCFPYVGVACRACWHACPFPDDAICLVELFVPRVFCRAICPLGALHSLLSRGALLHAWVRSGGEKLSCAQCTMRCPMGIRVMEDYVLAGRDSVADPECTRCGTCADVCQGQVIGLGIRKMAPILPSCTADGSAD